ncbi:hypothetical protein P280DRAFT_432060 [Massarina eburnea CBS 473.64]|uniref:mRNA export factor GLE1 n=1 Tax=Massarina eburnea CBS 473.64 TaxID=1395130 RepID=A0A6A6RUD0_9PLEO|nr:hypothetical protein P280DRAFT_432060 [Massarina eburnea CBS 473.64]
MAARSGASSSSKSHSTSMGSSWLNSSPSRQSPTRNGARSNRGSLILSNSPSRQPQLNDSPSRQMQLEFNKLLSRSDQDFNHRLDQAAAERQRIADEELAKAAQEHLRIQEGAKLEIQRILLEQEQEKQRREEAQRREIERLKLEKAQQEAESQRQRLEAKRKEEELAQQAVEHQKRIQEADARAKEQQQQQVQRQKEEAERKAREAAAAQERARLQTQAPPAAPATATHAAPISTPAVRAPVTSATSASALDAEGLHRKYMELHARMKKFRIEFFNETKKVGHPMKAVVGDARRAIRLNLGQISTARSTTMHAIKEIREKCFDVAMKTHGPTIDIRPFLVSRQVPFQSDAEARYPAFLLYLWICFEKSVIAQWKSEAANQDSTVPQEIGLLAASLYADRKYMLKEIPMNDIMLAKIHRKCPVLFGIRGNTNTEQGLVRLGLDKYRDDENDYAQMTSGIAAGFASLTLRSFKSTAPVFDLPDYWRAVASIINTPSTDIYPGHLLALKGLLRDFADKFIYYYGSQAKAVMKRAVTAFPDRAPKDRQGVASAAELVKVLPDTWKQNKGIIL